MEHLIASAKADCLHYTALARTTRCPKWAAKADWARRQLCAFLLVQAGSAAHA